MLCLGQSPRESDMDESIVASMSFLCTKGRYGWECSDTCLIFLGYSENGSFPQRLCDPNHKCLEVYDHAQSRYWFRLPSPASPLNCNISVGQVHGFNDQQG